LGMKTRSLGAHSGSLNKTLVARTRNLGASGDRAPVRQQPCPPQGTGDDKIMMHVTWYRTDEIVLFHT